MLLQTNPTGPVTLETASLRSISGPKQSQADPVDELLHVSLGKFGEKNETLARSRIGHRDRHIWQRKERSLNTVFTKKNQPDLRGNSVARSMRTPVKIGAKVGSEDWEGHH